MWTYTIQWNVWNLNLIKKIMEDSLIKPINPGKSPYLMSFDYMCYNNYFKRIVISIKLYIKFAVLQKTL